MSYNLICELIETEQGWIGRIRSYHEIQWRSAPHEAMVDAFLDLATAYQTYKSASL